MPNKKINKSKQATAQKIYFRYKKPLKKIQDINSIDFIKDHKCQMGFPRILSKNNKVYTKLGDFCLSGDNFWIVCHTCQEELQTQDQFWKHIQDEHNFLHGATKEIGRVTTAGNYACDADAGVAANINMPALSIYARKYLDDEQQQSQQQQQSQSQEQQQRTREGDDDTNESQHQRAAKDFVTQIQCSQATTANINIKLEPPTNLALTHDETQQTQRQPQQQQQQQNSQSSNVSQQLPENAGANAVTGIYHLPTLPPSLAQASSAFNATAATNSSTVTATIANLISTAAGTIPTVSMTVAPSTMAAAAILASQELPPKDSNSTTASASSAFSSDDGERWYICDYEACGLKFKYQSRLELHRAVHSKERRFICDLCNASFKQSCNLSTHRKKKHALKGSRSAILHQHL